MQQVPPNKKRLLSKPVGLNVGRYIGYDFPVNFKDAKMFTDTELTLKSLNYVSYIPHFM